MKLFDGFFIFFFKILHNYIPLYFLIGKLEEYFQFCFFYYKFQEINYFSLGHFFFIIFFWLLDFLNSNKKILTPPKKIFLIQCGGFLLLTFYDKGWNIYIFANISSLFFFQNHFHLFFCFSFLCLHFFFSKHFVHQFTECH